MTNSDSAVAIVLSCTEPEDCVVAMPYNCCLGCPQAMTRQELNQLDQAECWYESGHAEVNPPQHCVMDLCEACPLCFPQPLDADCSEGICVAQGEGISEV